MPEGFKKTIFYITFAALGVFWAEVTSTNIPGALVNPLAYLAYGLLYVFFIDALMRWDCRSFAIWYLFGVLVGLITETYLAKVTFYGPNPGAYRVFGVAPGPVMFIIFFYHAFYSFLAPAYLAKRILKIPLSLTPKRWMDSLIVLAPIILISQVVGQIIIVQRTIPGLMKLIGISAVILVLWVLALRSQGEIKNLLLTKKQRSGLLIFTIGVYIFFLFALTNKGHGHAPRDFPLIPMIVVSIIILGILVLIYKTLSLNKEPKEVVTYSAKDMNLPLFFGWLIYYLSITIILLLSHNFIKPFIKSGFLIFGVSGALIGTTSFIVSVVYLGRKLIAFGKK